MPSHLLALDQGSASLKWTLEWDASTLSITDPDGTLFFECPIDSAHRIIQTHELEAAGKVSFATPVGSITFKKNKNAVRDIRELVSNGLRFDVEFREAQKRQARSMLQLGSAAFVVGGGLFGLYCWWASWAADPPPGHWLLSIGWLIHLLLLVVAGVALAGLSAAFYSLKLLLRVRRVERHVRTA